MTTSIFEAIKHTNEHDKEYWLARELQTYLGYDEWEWFHGVIENAILACVNSNQKSQDHFAETKTIVSPGLGIGNKVSDYHLSRYACYLIAQNGDPGNSEIAHAQSYFAMQTRRQEISGVLIEDRKRLDLREELTEHNKNLAGIAKNAGVSDYREFTDYGYMGLYGNMRARDIHAKKKLQPNEKILDHMGTEELAANLFRATQAEAKIKREKIRSTISDIGGTMPEHLPTPESISEVKSRVKKLEKQESITDISI